MCGTSLVLWENGEMIKQEDMESILENMSRMSHYCLFILAELQIRQFCLFGCSQSFFFLVVVLLKRCTGINVALLQPPNLFLSLNTYLRYLHHLTCDHQVSCSQLLTLEGKYYLSFKFGQGPMPPQAPPGPTSNYHSFAFLAFQSSNRFPLSMGSLQIYLTLRPSSHDPS